MATATVWDRDRGAISPPEVAKGRGERFVDRGLPFAAIAGALGGALAGTFLGAEAETAFPVACGTLGTMLGSGLFASAWCRVVPLWAPPFTGRVTSHVGSRGP